MCGSGSSQPSTQTVVQKNEIPQYLQDFSQENIDVARDIGNRGYPVYPNQRIADPSNFTQGAQNLQNAQYGQFWPTYNEYQNVINSLSGMGRAAYGQPGAATMAPVNATAGTFGQQATAGTYGQPLPGVGQATASAYGQPVPQPGSFGQQATAGTYGQQLTPGSIAPWMSPFVDLALQPQLRAAQRQGMASGRQIASNAVGAGAFGDARTGVEMGENTRNTNTLLSDITGQGYQSAYDRAVQSSQNAFTANTGQFNTEQAAQRAAIAQNAGQFNTENQARLAAWGAGAGQFNTEGAALRQAIGQNNQANLAAWGAGAGQFNTEDAAKRAAIAQNAGQFNTEDAARRAAAQQNAQTIMLNNAANLDVYRAGAGQFNANQAGQLAALQGVGNTLGQQNQYVTNLTQQLYAGGQQDEQNRQRSLDLAYQDYINQFEYPNEMLNLRLATGQGVPYTTTRLTQTPYSATGQTIGTLASLYGLFGRPAGGGSQDLAQQLATKLTG